MQSTQLVSDHIDNHTTMIDYPSSKCRCSTRPGPGVAAAAAVLSLSVSDKARISCVWP
jgi:hypothetical protein